MALAGDDDDDDVNRADNRRNGARSYDDHEPQSQTHHVFPFSQYPSIPHDLVNSQSQNCMQTLTIKHRNSA